MANVAEALGILMDEFIQRGPSMNELKDVIVHVKPKASIAAYEIMKRGDHSAGDLAFIVEKRENEPESLQAARLLIESEPNEEQLILILDMVDDRELSDAVTGMILRNDQSSIGALWAILRSQKSTFHNRNCYLAALRLAADPETCEGWLQELISRSHLSEYETLKREVILHPHVSPRILVQIMRNSRQFSESGREEVFKLAYQRYLDLLNDGDYSHTFLDFLELLQTPGELKKLARRCLAIKFRPSMLESVADKLSLAITADAEEAFWYPFAKVKSRDLGELKVILKRMHGQSKRNEVCRCILRHEEKDAYALVDSVQTHFFWSGILAGSPSFQLLSFLAIKAKDPLVRVSAAKKLLAEFEPTLWDLNRVYSANPPLAKEIREFIGRMAPGLSEHDLLCQVSLKESDLSEPAWDETLRREASGDYVVNIETLGEIVREHPDFRPKAWELFKLRGSQYPEDYLYQLRLIIKEVPELAEEAKEEEARYQKPDNGSLIIAMRKLVGTYD